MFHCIDYIHIQLIHTSKNCIISSDFQHIELSIPSLCLINYNSIPLKLKKISFNSISLTSVPILFDIILVVMQMNTFSSTFHYDFLEFLKRMLQKLKKIRIKCLLGHFDKIIKNTSNNHKY